MGGFIDSSIFLALHRRMAKEYLSGMLLKATFNPRTHQVIQETADRLGVQKGQALSMAIDILQKTVHSGGQSLLVLNAERAPILEILLSKKQ